MVPLAVEHRAPCPCAPSHLDGLLGRGLLAVARPSREGVIELVIIVHGLLNLLSCVLSTPEVCSAVRPKVCSVKTRLPISG